MDLLYRFRDGDGFLFDARPACGLGFGRPHPARAQRGDLADEFRSARVLSAFDRVERSSARFHGNVSE